MGWPVQHSRSPALHGHWLARYRLDGAYLPLPVPPAGLAAALRALPLLGFAGCNLTVPHKEAALRLVDEAEETARRIGAVNTVVVGRDGRLIGSNTDAFGFRASLEAAVPDGTATAGPALVIGAGGAARAVLFTLAESGVPELRLTNRSPERAEAVAADLDVAVTRVPWQERAAALDGVALLVNTTSLGMTGQPPLALDLAALPRDAVVTDLVYAPLETELLRAARARGLRTIDGLGMLLHQARPGFEAWFGVRPTVDAALRAAVLAG